MREFKVVEKQKDLGCEYRYNDTYIKNEEIMVRRTDTSLKIVDISDVYKPGKKAISLSLFFEDTIKLIKFIDSYDKDYKNILKVFTETDRKEENFYYKSDAYSVSIKTIKNVFSPFHVERLKPLKEAPKKWNRPLAIRALMNGQCENVRLDYHISDDSRYDIENKDVVNIKALVKDFIENSSASILQYGDNVCLHYHDNLSYSFSFKL